MWMGAALSELSNNRAMEIPPSGLFNAQGGQLAAHQFFFLNLNEPKTAPSISGIEMSQNPSGNICPDWSEQGAVETLNGLLQRKV